MMEKKKILITVKTYPNLSTQYDELVCTAGVLEDGSWIRLYPIPFRRIDYEKQYKKYNWIEVTVRKRTKDMRPESFTPDIATIKFVGRIDTKDNWKIRKEYVLKNVYKDMPELIELAHENKLSLAVFKPTKIIDFQYAKTSEQQRKTYRDKTGRILKERRQLKLIDDDLKNINPVTIPDYRFYYHFTDVNGKPSRMMIEDWETQALYRNCLAKGEEAAARDVRKKYWDDFALTKDLYLILGTTLEFHRRKVPNPFTIIGTFSPKRVSG